MESLTVDQALKVALDHHQAGRLFEAESIYRSIVDQYPRHADALHLLGVLVGQAGRADLAVEFIERAIAVAPSVPDFHGNLSEFCRRLGKLDRAVASCRRAIELKPAYFQAYNSLGVALSDLGRFDEAIEAFAQAIALRPNYAEAHSNLGNVLRNRGRWDEAIAACQKAVEYQPRTAVFFSNLGIALRSGGKVEEALSAFRQAVELQPKNAEAQLNLGNLLRDTGRVDEAIAACRRAIAINPKLPEAHSNLGNALREKGLPEEAAAAYRQAIELRPDYVNAHGNLGVALRDQGLLDESIESLRTALALDPDSAAHNSNLLYALWYHPGYDARAVLAEHQRWDRRQVRPLAPQIRPHRNERSGERRLKIGYVSPDFRKHAAAFFLVPLLEHHDAQNVEVFCYSGAIKPDEITERCRKLAHHWLATLGMGDEELAQQIRRDRIDVLIDLTLHMANSRMMVFARKPAPVQVTWLGYPGTTGNSAIDCRLSDPYLDPPGTRDELYTEKTIRLSRTFWCYRPIVDTPAVNALPARERGQITFGCLNNFAKVSGPALEIWSAILANVAGSRLILQARPGSHRRKVVEKFASAGVTEERIEFVDFLPMDEYFQMHHRLDVCLDPMPYTGHTTTLDALWMGVPTITMALTDTAVSRAGISILSNARLPEFIAGNREQYIAIAQRVAGDLEGLADVRVGLRERMQASPLMDAAGMAGELEGVYRNLFQEWCATR